MSKPHNVDALNVETVVIHAGEPSPRIGGSAVPPIFQSTVFETGGETGGETSYEQIRYPRLNNLPNHIILNTKIAALEHGEAGLVCASGMAAFYGAILGVVESGDHILVQRGVYGGVHSIVVNDFPRLGITYDFIDPSRPDSWTDKLTPKTRAICTEAMSNPLLQVIDHRAVVEFATANKLVSIIDNTFASPVNFRPLSIGYDVSFHSATKYLNGHSDITAGAVIGTGEQIATITKRLNHFGANLDAHACFLLHRGLRTLALRVERQNANALAIATHLHEHPAILRVNYPGLPTHPEHDLAASLFSGFGGTMSFELRAASGEDAADAATTVQFIERLSLPIHGPSLGGVESLITRPAATSHSSISPEDRKLVGVSDGLVRMSIGIEHVGDLIADLDQALAG